jgi:hypothetical protein
VCLIFAFESDLKPNTMISLGDRLKRNGLDFAVIQPCADPVHNFTERKFRFLLDSHDERGIERQDALLPLPVRREHGLSVGAASLAGHTNGARYWTLVRVNGQNCSLALILSARVLLHSN